MQLKCRLLTGTGGCPADLCRWEIECDWMAMHGVNLVVAFNGQVQLQPYGPDCSVRACPSLCPSLCPCLHVFLMTEIAAAVRPSGVPVAGSLARAWADRLRDPDILQWAGLANAGTLPTAVPDCLQLPLPTHYISC